MEKTTLNLLQQLDTPINQEASAINGNLKPGRSNEEDTILPGNFMQLFGRSIYQENSASNQNLGYQSVITDNGDNSSRSIFNEVSTELSLALTGSHDKNKNIQFKDDQSRSRRLQPVVYDLFGKKLTIYNANKDLPVPSKRGVPFLNFQAWLKSVQDKNFKKIAKSYRNSRTGRSNQQDKMRRDLFQLFKRSRNQETSASNENSEPGRSKGEYDMTPNLIQYLGRSSVQTEITDNAYKSLSISNEVSTELSLALAVPGSHDKNNGTQVKDHCNSRQLQPVDLPVPSKGEVAFSNFQGSKNSHEIQEQCQINLLCQENAGKSSSVSNEVSIEFSLAFIAPDESQDRNNNIQVKDECESRRLQPRVHQFGKKLMKDKVNIDLPVPTKRGGPFSKIQRSKNVIEVLDEKQQSRKMNLSCHRPNPSSILRRTINSGGRLKSVQGKKFKEIAKKDRTARPVLLKRLRNQEISTINENSGLVGSNDKYDMTPNLIEYLGKSSNQTEIADTGNNSRDISNEVSTELSVALNAPKSQDKNNNIEVIDQSDSRKVQPFDCSKAEYVFTKKLTTYDVAIALHVPAKSGVPFLNFHGSNNKIEVLDENQESWEMKLSCPCPNPNIPPLCTIYDGWLKFVRDKKLDSGDYISVYKLPDSKNEFKIAIIKEDTGCKGDKLKGFKEETCRRG